MRGGVLHRWLVVPLTAAVLYGGTPALASEPVGSSPAPPTALPSAAPLPPAAPRTLPRASPPPRPGPLARAAAADRPRPAPRAAAAARLEGVWHACRGREEWLSRRRAGAGWHRAAREHLFRRRRSAAGRGNLHQGARPGGAGCRRAR